MAILDCADLGAEIRRSRSFPADARACTRHSLRRHGFLKVISIKNVSPKACCELIQDLTPVCDLLGNAYVQSLATAV